MCTHNWRGDVGAFPEYDVLEKGAADQLWPSPVDQRFLTDPIYRNCTGNVTPTPAAHVMVASHTRERVCFERDDKTGLCLVDDHGLRNAMPQCPACCTVTGNQMVAVIPPDTLSDQKGYVVVQTTYPDGSQGTTSVQLDRGSSTTASVFTATLPSSEGTPVPGRYDILMP
jgi:hypothetical protein